MQVEHEKLCTMRVFVNHTYNEIAVVHFVNFINKLPFVVFRSEMVVLINTGSSVAKMWLQSETTC